MFVVVPLHATFVEVGLTGKHIGGIVRLLAVWLWRLVVTMVQYAPIWAGISLALDSEMYFGRSEKEFWKLLVEGEYRSRLLPIIMGLNAAEPASGPADGWLSTELLKGCFCLLPILPTSLFMPNEVWFALGDMTMAEHAAIRE